MLGLRLRSTAETFETENARLNKVLAERQNQIDADEIKRKQGNMLMLANLTGEARKAAEAVE